MSGELSFGVETVWDNGTTFAQDVPEGRADILRVRANATVFFKNSVNFSIACNLLLLEGNVFFDGRGADGANAVKPARKPDVYCSGTPAQHQREIHPYFIKFASERGYGHFGYDAFPGEDGRPGAKILIVFNKYAGEFFDPAKQTDVGGGQGGLGAPGGDGPYIHCTIDPCGGVLPAGAGLSSGPGARGSNGSFTLKKGDAIVRVLDPVRGWPLLGEPPHNP